MIPSFHLPLKLYNSQDSASRTPLFLMHPAGGVIFPFATLLPYLSPTQPVYALQARGIYDDLPPFESLEALASATIVEMKTIQPTGPYTISGWSFGGMVAFKIARQLTRQGDVVAFLGVIDAYPHTSDQTMSRENQSPLAELQLFFHLLGDSMGSDFRSLSDALFVSALEQEQPVDWLLGQISQQDHRLALDPAIIKRIWLTLKRNRQLMQAYQPQHYAGAITLFYTEDAVSADGPQRWQALTSHPVDMVRVNGEHMTMLNVEHVETLGRALELRLQQVNGESETVLPASPLAPAPRPARRFI